MYITLNVIWMCIMYACMCLEKHSKLLSRKLVCEGVYLPPRNEACMDTSYYVICFSVLSFTFYMALAISIIHIDEGGLSNKLRMQQIPLQLDRSSQHRGTSLRMHASSPVWQLYWESVIYGVSKHCESHWSTVHTVDYCDILINAWQIIELIGQLPSSSQKIFNLFIFPLLYQKRKNKLYMPPCACQILYVATQETIHTVLSLCHLFLVSWTTLWPYMEY